MERLAQAWRRLKEKYWDEELITERNPPMLYFRKPPLRQLWDHHKGRIIPLSKWLAGLIIGALILTIVGLN